MSKPLPLVARLGGVGKPPRLIVRMGAAWAKLAASLKLPPNVLRDLRLNEDAPKRPLLLEWVKYRERMKTEGRLILDDKESAALPTVTTLRDKKVHAEIRLLEAKVAKEERRVVPIGDVSALLTHLGATVRAQLYDALETEAPPKLVGRDAVAIRKTLREMADEICATMADIVTQFERDEIKAQTRKPSAPAETLPRARASS